MEHTRYTSHELLALQGSKAQAAFEQQLLRNAKGNPVLIDIMRQRHSLRHRRGVAFLSRSNMDARKSSSAESEEPVFVRVQPLQPVEVPSQPKLVQQTATHREDVTQLDGQAGRQLDGQEGEPGPQPPAETLHQRPALPDQKRKGFEQFYEAVRSPTHVRVTAGGRIVPNTLDASQSSPTGKGAKEKFVNDFNNYQPMLPSQPFTGAQFIPPILGPMHPAMHPAFSLMAPGPGVVPPFGGFPMQPFAFPPVPGPAFVHQSNPLMPMMPMGFMGYQQPPTPVSAGAPRADAYSTSIRPSIITKNQLSGLRSSLKKAEAQLAYNRHQIDEKHMEEYARQLRADIDHFEVKLKGELALEVSTSTYPAGDDADTFKAAAATSAMEQSKTAATAGADEVKATRRKKDRVKLTVDTAIPLERKSVLPVSAALAPVFQPLEKMPDGRSLSGGRFYGPVPVNVEESNRYLSAVAPPTPAQDLEEFSNFARDNAGLALPYLVGEVPFGMDPGPDVRDYIYHRSLDHNEEMAKHLFWTDAPEHLRKRFPKFDGKDFYPASPEKQPRPKPSATGNLPTGRPEQDYGFSLPTAGLDPFAPLEPYRGGANKAPSVREREPDQKRATKSDNVTSPMKKRGGNKLRPVAYFNSQGLEESRDSSGSSENVAETDSERAYFNACVRAWSERVTATATALPGAVTTENVRGYLPQYTIGHAAASLSPAIIKAAGQLPRLSSPKANGVQTNAGVAPLAVSADNRVENRHPLRIS